VSSINKLAFDCSLKIRIEGVRGPNPLSSTQKFLRSMADLSAIPGQRRAFCPVTRSRWQLGQEDATLRARAIARPRGTAPMTTSSFETE
jgi:hypothetical protein